MKIHIVHFFLVVMFSFFLVSCGVDAEQIAKQPYTKEKVNNISAITEDSHPIEYRRKYNVCKGSYDRCVTVSNTIFCDNLFNSCIDLILQRKTYD